MTRRSVTAAAAAVALLTASAAGRQAPSTLQGTPSASVPRLSAATMRVYDAPAADQGVAVDATHFYAVDNSEIAKHELATGRLVDTWRAPSRELVRHMNSCLVDGERLLCANSNYPLTPMASSIEIFETATLDHADSHSLGMLDEGSLTWFDRVAGGWIAGFAHYDEDGGLPFKDHRFSSVVAFDGDWRRTGGWVFPPEVIARMNPHAASGGVIGPDGWLYLMGHDRPEMYVVGRPTMGPTLVHLATIDLEAEGQAFAWAPGGQRTVYAIDRRKHLVRAIAVPALPPDLPPLVRRFR